jgi:TPR repeat protein
VKWYRKAAEQGHALAQNNLGAMYLQGMGVATDLQEAAKWYRKAADQNLAEAQYNLGLMCAQGIGMPQDYPEAAAWFREAAEQGFAAAQKDLGLLYANGTGVPEDFVEACKWFSLAAAGNNAEVSAVASRARDQIRQQMSQAQVAEAARRAAVFLPHAAEPTKGRTVLP